MTLPTLGARFPGPGQDEVVELSHALGAGAFGLVFEAREISSGLRVAVKFPHAGLMGGSELQAFENELMAAKQVRHEHVLSVLFAHPGCSSYPPYLISEYADGGRLYDRIEEAKHTHSHDLASRLEWAFAVVDGMAAVNAVLLHRDLKPDNILFHGGVLKIADFGLAKLVGAATRTATFKGGQHVLYMAPEAWDGERNLIQLDMYSAGIVLNEILALKYPYSLPDASAPLDAYRRMHLLQRPEVPRAVNPELPQRISDCILRLLSKRPEDRYASWSDVRHALEAGSGAGGERSSVPTLISEASRRHQEAIAASLAADARRRETEEQSAIDALQAEEIVSRFRALADTFNDSTEGPKASLEQTSPRSWRLRLPYAAHVDLTFFPVNPALRLDSHTARFAARVSDPDGCGFNLLLRRGSEEQFGTWTVCHVRGHALMQNPMSQCSEFGLPPDKIVEIERGLHAVHVYVPTLSPDIDAALSRFVETLYRKR